MAISPTANAALLQQLAALTLSLKSGAPAESVLPDLAAAGASLPPDQAALLHEMSEALGALREGCAGATAKELTRVVDHQVRTAAQSAVSNLQIGEMELGQLVPVLDALGDRQGLEILEQVRTRIRTARENFLRATSFLDALGRATAAPKNLNDSLQRLMNWRPEAVGGPAAAPAAAAAALHSVLFVEDDPDAGEILEMAINRFDFVSRVARAMSYGGALQVFEADASFSLLVTDYHLLDSETGLDLARELRRRKPDIRLVFLSGSISELSELLTSEEKSSSLLVEKPIDLDSLEMRLREFVAAQ